MSEDEIDTERARSAIMLHRMRFVRGFGLAGAGVGLGDDGSVIGPGVLGACFMRGLRLKTATRW